MRKDLQNNVNEFYSLIEKVKEEERLFSQQSIDTEWLRLYKKINKSNRKKKRFFFNFSIAAVISLLLATSYFFLIKQIGTKTTHFEMIAESFQEESEVDLITLIVDGKIVKSTKEYSTIFYLPNGIVTVDNERVSENKKSKDKKPVSGDYNCVIVPKGKQINLLLSDGTKLYVNSRSRLIYPKVFDTKRREIYIEGEAYLEVAHNKTVPFVVKTIDLDIEVLGTVFNVSSFKELKKSTITLVEGSVKVIDHEKNEVKLKPSQSVEYFSGKLEKPKNTDVSLHTDWAHGYYIFNSTPLQEVLTKLSFYQDIDFECDMSVRNLRLSGKLNIRTSFKDILQNLSETAGLEFIPKGNGCIAVTSTNQ